MSLNCSRYNFAIGNFLFLAICLTGVLGSVSAFAEQAVEAPLPGIAGIEAHLEKLAISGDEKSVASLFDQIERDKRKNSNYPYSDALQLIASKMAGRTKLSPEKGAQFLIKAAALIVNARPMISPGAQERALHLLFTSSEVSSNAELRASAEKVMLQSLRNISSARDPKYSSDGIPSAANGTISVAPSIETGMPSGVAPAAIEDPRLRAKYEEAIRENSELIRKNNLQGEIAEVLSHLEDSFGMYVNDAYGSKDLFEKGKALIAQTPFDKKARDLLLNQLADQVKSR